MSQRLPVQTNRTLPVRQSFRKAYGDKPDCSDASETFNICGNCTKSAIFFTPFICFQMGDGVKNLLFFVVRKLFS